MGDKINSACLSIEDDRVFVSFKDGVLRTATGKFWRTYRTGMFVVKLESGLSKVPRRAQQLRITNWHHKMPVKIEAKGKGIWETIFERSELPDNIHCLANCGSKNCSN